MTTQMIICLVIFILTLMSYALNRIPMWLTSLLSVCALCLFGSDGEKSDKVCISYDGCLRFLLRDSSNGNRYSTGRSVHRLS